MLSFTSQRRLRAILIAVALVVGVLPVSAGPVSAAYPAVATDCPAGNLDYGIDHWNKIYPGIGQPDRGVTLCQGMGPSPTFGVMAYAQIIRPDAGARLRIISDPIADCANNFWNPTDYAPWYCSGWDTLFTKRTAEDWFMDMDSINTVMDPDLLFGTTNAGFFNDTSSFPTTGLALPEFRLEYGLNDLGLTSTTGYAWITSAEPEPDFAWEADKRYLRFSDPRETSQEIAIGELPQSQYCDNHHFCMDIPWYEAMRPDYDEDVRNDATMAFSMDQTSVDEYARRTVMGNVHVDARTETVILTTAEQYTIEDVNDILDEIGVDEEERIQLDGGNSTSMFNKLGGVYSLESSYPFGARKVPEILAIYEAPEE